MPKSKSTDKQPELPFVSQQGPTKICYRCNRAKPLAEFYPDKRRKHSYVCISCERGRGKSRYSKSPMAIAVKKEREEVAKLRKQGLKKCSGCLQAKPFKAFYRKKEKGAKYTARCKQCETTRHGDWSNKNRDHLRDYNKTNRQNNAGKLASQARCRNERMRSSDSPWYVLNRLAKHSARRSLPCDDPITTQHLMDLFESQGKCCALSGAPLTWGPGYCSPTSISLDRIEHDKGYSIGNVRIVCYAVNAFRHRMTDAEMLLMAKAIVAKMAPDPDPMPRLYDPLTFVS